MKIWLATAVFFALLSSAANAQCVEVERAVAVMAAAEQRHKTDLATADSAMSSTPNRKNLADFLAQAADSSTRTKRAFDQAIALIRRAIAQKCAFGPVYEKIVADYTRLSLRYGADARAFRMARAEALRSNFGPNNMAKNMTILRERSMAARR